MDINFQELISDIKTLDITKLATKYSENHFLDFKEYCPLYAGGGKPDDAIETDFIKDVSAFANTKGGFLVYGIREKDKKPVELKPFDIPILEDLEDQLGQLIRSRTEPSFHGYKFYPIQMQDEKYIFIVAVDKHEKHPIAIKLAGKNYYELYHRSVERSNIPLKYNELVDAIVVSNSRKRKIKEFRKQRIKEIIEQSPSVKSDAKIVLHLISQDALVEDKNCYDVEQFYDNYQKLHPIEFVSLTRDINSDGFKIYEHSADSIQEVAYVQVYRSGIIEALDPYTLRQKHILENILLIPGGVFEAKIINAIHRYLSAFKQMQINLPVSIGITLIGIKGFKIAVSNNLIDLAAKRPINEDLLLLPEMEIPNVDLSRAELAKLMKKTFDKIWQAFGYTKSINYCESGDVIYR